MYIIKTDMELQQDIRKLEKKYNGLCLERNKLNDIQERLYDTWRLIKDPFVKRIVHKEIYKVNEMIMRMNFEIERVYCDLHHVKSILYSAPSPNYGCIYDTYHDLDYDIININNVIRGVKL